MNTGRTALVTGSTDGIGAAIARALAAERIQVVITGRDAERGHRAVVDIADKGGTATFVAADLSAGKAAIDELADEAEAIAGGPLNILINNAAMLIEPKPTAEVSEQLIDDALAVNVRATFLLTGRIAPRMAEGGGGVIINIGSINGLTGMANSALYSATKATIHSLTKSWANEYGPAGVRVNTVAPGPTVTRRTAAMTDRLAPMIAKIPSRRPSDPAEIAAAVVFLASDEAANIHGATLSVDGGMAVA